MKMKLIALACLLFYGIAAQAQTLAVNETDPATGNKLIKTSNLHGAEHDLDDSVVKSGVVFFSAGYQLTNPTQNPLETYYIDLNIVHNDNRLGCLEQLKSHIILTLDDGSAIECFQISDTDCDPNAYYASFALMPKGGNAAMMKQNFEKLIHTPIIRIEVVTSETKVVYKVKKGSMDYLKQHFALIDKTVKAATK